MPYCESCGREVEAEWNVCPECGNELAVAAESGGGGDEGRDASLSEQLTESPEEQPPAMSRRAALAAGGGAVGLLALGFLGIRFLSSTEHRDATETAWSDRQVQSTGAGRLVTGSVSLAPGEFLAEQFTVEGGAGLRVTVTEVENGPLDIYTVPDDDIGAYREGGRVDFVSRLSQSDVAGARSVQGIPPSGDYWLVIDNTAVYDAEPTGELTLQAEMGVEQP